MSNETTTTEAAPASNATETPSPLQETPSSTVENIPQAEGDFATWLSDRLDKFEKGEEAAPWAQKEEQEPNVDQKEAEDPAVVEGQEDKEDSKDKEEGAEEEDEEVDDSVETKSMSAAAGAKFKELKAELKEYKAKLAEAQKAMEEAKGAAPANPEEVESLRSKLSEYEQEIAVTRVEATDEYKRAVLEPTQAILDAASSLAERYKLDARKLVNALREESVAEGSDTLTELAGDFSERDRVRLYRMADDLADVSRRRDYLRENASKAYAEMQERQATEEKQAQERYKQVNQAAAEKTWSEIFQDKPFVSSLEKNVLAEVQRSASEADLFETPAEERAFAVYSGLLMPHIVKQLEASQVKVSELEKALSKYKKASPKVSGNTDTTPPVADEVGFLDAIEKRFSLG
jgi:hypothetical protein